MNTSTSLSNWHNEVFAEDGWFDMVDKEFKGMVYCEECYAVVGELDECLCLVDRSEFVQNILQRSKVGKEVGKGLFLNQQCCGGGCN